MTLVLAWPLSLCLVAVAEGQMHVAKGMGHRAIGVLLEQNKPWLRHALALLLLSTFSA